MINSIKFNPFYLRFVWCLDVETVGDESGEGRRVVGIYTLVHDINISFGCSVLNLIIAPDIL